MSGATIVGVLGGGQLGRMLALAGVPMGVRFRFFDPSAEAPAGHVGDLVVGSYEDEAALERFAEGVDVATYEFENVPLRAVEVVERFAPVRPGARALAAAQDRPDEKSTFARLGLPTPAFMAVDDGAGLVRGVERVGLPAVLKTRRLGYDGRGQRVLRSAVEVQEAARGVDAPSIVEAFVPFERELSILAVRGVDGRAAAYPLVENTHREGILRRSIFPAPTPGPRARGEGLQQEAEGIARTLLEHLEYVGLLAVELFEQDDRLLLNEMAPRVHNSGHGTIEGAVTSQFENHVRAILGWPLGSTEPTGVSAMLNVIGDLPPPEAVLAIPGAHLHRYGKAPRPGRKVGHVTLVDDSYEALERRLADLEAALSSS